MELQEALTQISEIRQQMARTEVFRGYRALPVAFTGMLAVLAAFGQTQWISDPLHEISTYLELWIGTAIVGVFASGTEMVLRSRSACSELRREVTWLAVEQFVPCLVSGALLTVVLTRSAPETLWMLPGLWQILFGLGIFASCRLLPRATFGVAVFYLLTGLTSLSFARGEWALSPWVMGLPFGFGQLFAAAVLYRTLERHDDHA